MTLAVEVKGLTYVYPDGSAALDDVSFTINENERVGLVGPNGAGKSTLLLLLNGLILCEGRITIFGEPVSARTLGRVRRMTGMVFQDPNDQLFCPTVYDDVAFGLKNMRLPGDEIKRRVTESLAAVGAEGLEKKAPHHLSLGQKKRVAIATALSMRPKILTLDEPTASLDPKGRRELMALLEKIGGTQIIATHDLDMVKKMCDRAIVLFGGKVAADGAPSKVFGDEGWLLAHGLA